MALKKSLDSDVFKDVGGETYEKARKHFGEGKEMFENPKLMKDLNAHLKEKHGLAIKTSPLYIDIDCIIEGRTELLNEQEEEQLQKKLEMIDAAAMNFYKF